MSTSKAPIRTHAKSRRGCKTCKRRKVKCDEATPRCRNCTKRDIECDWPSASDQPPDSSLGVDPPDYNVSPSLIASPSPTPSNFVPKEPALHVFDMTSMELLHHYTTATYLTLVEGPTPTNEEGFTLAQTFQVLAPKLAMAHPFLMHFILSISALHLHNVNRDVVLPKDYYSLATYHVKQGKMKMDQHSCPESSCPGEGSCSHVITARFLSYGCQSLFDLCQITHASHALHPINSLIEWIEERHNFANYVYHPHITELFSGPLGKMLQLVTSFWSPTGPSNYPSPHIPFSASLSTIHIPGCGAPDNNELSDPSVSEVYNEAVKNLKVAYQMAFDTGYRLRALSTWACSLPLVFIQFLKEKRPRALTILAHFCALYLRGPLDGRAEDSALRWWMIMGRDNHITLIKDMLNEEWVTYLGLTLMEARATTTTSTSMDFHDSPQSPPPVPQFQMNTDPHTNLNMDNNWEMSLFPTVYSLGGGSIKK